ncbi:hypothetical protein BA895_15440 [Humibacillus sp. DSM 29435]|uniref:ATP-binding cassette domain-containing protein n=1 Tax=Humibacillus sp. DSM 29435 TaxID=1869167 RepID=UPI0008734172|nr:hypothetical protein BA895_15440 [Humibacillus sp. DSM 29435]
MTAGVTTPTAVTLSELSRRFGSVLALDGLSWQAPTGRVTAVLGPNGAGKTTAIECAVGLTRPTSGSVTVLGADPLTALSLKTSPVVRRPGPFGYGALRKQFVYQSASTTSRRNSSRV